jgi:sugar lactone lactonase YvrE
VVIDHLNNPRGLEINGGTLYIAAAGRGSGGHGKCLKRGENAGGTCPGASSQVIRAAVSGDHRLLAEKLPSYAGKDGSFATGVDDVSRASDGSLFGIETYALPAGVKVLPKAARKFNGQLIKVDDSTSPNPPKPVGNVSAFEFKHDPDKQGKDSDPYAVLAVSAHTAYVADAAGNDLLKVHDGKVSLVTVFKNIGKNQPVPTTIAQGPDGKLYVGTLIGFAPGGKDKARVIQVDPKTGKQTVYARGLNRVTGVDFDSTGKLYVTELSTTGINPNAHGAVMVIPAGGGTPTLLPGSDQLEFPQGGVVSDDDSTFYVSNWSILPAHTDPSGQFGGNNGQVVSLPTG